MHRASRTVAAGLLALTACSSPPAQVPIDMPDWSTSIELTRGMDPVRMSIEVLVEVDDTAVGGHAVTGFVGWNDGLADLTLFDPLTDRPLSRVIIDGATGYLLSDAAPFRDALPDGAEIVRAPRNALVAAGIVPEDVEHLTGVLGLLRGATSATQEPAGTISVEIDLSRALAAMSASEREGLAVDFDDLTEVTAVGEVDLRPDGTIEVWRVRVEALRGEQEYLLNGAAAFEPVPTNLTFDPPPASRVVDLADVADLADLWPG